MATPKELEPLLEKYAVKHDIDPCLVKAIISQESNWDILALRYEPGYKWIYKVDTCAKKAHVSLDTELTTQKMSWGLGQIMGGLAREQGLRGPMPLLLQPEINIEHICIRLKYLKGLSISRDDLFAMYNGGPGAIKRGFGGDYINQSYVDSVNQKYLAEVNKLITQLL